MHGFLRPVADFAATSGFCDPLSAVVKQYFEFILSCGMMITSGAALFALRSYACQPAGNLSS